MPKLCRISGRKLIKILLKEGFCELRQKGSHVRLAKTVENHTYFLTVPLHSELDRGTLSEIISILEKSLTEENIKKLFYK